MRTTQTLNRAGKCPNSEDGRHEYRLDSSGGVGTYTWDRHECFHCGILRRTTYTRSSKTISWEKP